MKDSLLSDTSYWESQQFLKGYDVLIIGSGIVGLNAAIRLKEASKNVKVGVLERGTLPNGASTKNAGFACFGSISELVEQKKKGDEQELLKLVEYRWRGLETLRNLLGEKAIKYQALGGYELFEAGDQTLFEHCRDLLPYFNTLFKETIGSTDIYAVSDAKIADFGFKGIKHLIENRCEAQIDTGHMMQSLLAKAHSMGILILNGVQVDEIIGEEPIALKAGNLVFECKQLLIATNAFAQQLVPELDVVPGRGQVLVTAPIPDLKIKGTFHYDKGYYYFRNIDNRILLGGGRNLDFEGETTYSQGHTETIQNRLEQLLSEVILPHTPVAIEQRWSGIMGFGKELSPILKALGKNRYCAVRCNGMGLAMGSTLGRKAAEMMLSSSS